MFEKFIHQTPFFRFVLPLILGIVFKIQFPELHVPFLFITAAIFIIILMLHIGKQTRNYLTNRIWGVFIFAFIFSTGIGLSQLKQNKQFYFQDKEYTFIASITQKPEEKENSVKAILKMEAYKDSVNWIQNNSNLLLYFEKDSASAALEPGDRLLIRAYINEIKHSGNPYAFNYKNYLKYQEIYSQVYVKAGSYKIIARNQGSPILLASHQLREKLLQVYKKYQITDNEFAVLSALTLGYKNELTPELKESFSASGAMHVLAVSGLHVGIIFIVLTKLLFFLNRYKRGKFIQSTIIIAALFFYAGLTGFSNSVIRASIMFSFISVGNMFVRRISIYNSLSAAAFCMLLYNPYSLMNVGFQLSFIAVISIVFFQPKIYSIITPKTRFGDYVWQLIAVAIAAQIGTFPLTLYYFNQFPLYFILSNILIIPIVSIIIYGAITLFVFSFSSSVAAIISKIVVFFTKLLNWNVAFIEQLPYAKLDHIILDQVQVIILFGFILTVTFFIISRRSIFFKQSCYFLLFLAIYNVGNYINLSKKSYFVVHQIPKSTALHFIDGNKSQVYANLNADDSTQNIEYNILPLWMNQKIKNKSINELSYQKSFNYFQHKNLRIAQIGNNKLQNFKTANKLKVNYLILSNNTELNIQDLQDYFDFEQVIFDSSNSYYKISRWKKECDDLKIKSYSISDQGAYVKYL